MTHKEKTLGKTTVDRHLHSSEGTKVTERWVENMKNRILKYLQQRGSYICEIILELPYFI